jgi:hypothetical protein
MPSFALYDLIFTYMLSTTVVYVHTQQHKYIYIHICVTYIHIVG